METLAAPAAMPPAHRLRALHEAVLAVSVPVDGTPEAIAPLVTEVVSRAVAVLRASGGAIALADHPAWNALVPGTTAQDGHVMLRHTGQAERRIHRPGGTALGALEGHASHVADTLAPEHGGAYDWLATSGVRSFCAIPLRAAGQDVVLGALLMNFSAPGDLPEEDWQLLELFATHAAAVVQRVRQASYQHRRTTQATKMAEILSRVAAAASVEGVMEALLRGAMTLLGGSDGTVRLIDPATQEQVLALDLIQEDGEWATRWHTARLPTRPGTNAAALAAGGPSVLIDDFAHAPETYPLKAEMLSADRRSAVNVPINAVGQRIGSLHINHPHPRFFSQADLALAEALAALAGDAIERAKLEATRAERARLDAALLVARTVSHEINNALAPITGYAELLSLHPTVTGDDLLVTYARRILWASVEVVEKVKQLQHIIRLEPAESTLGPELSVLDLERSTSPAGFAPLAR